jgi:hypothetical protein
MLEEIGKQPEIGHLNPETSEPRTQNPGTDTQK